MQASTALRSLTRPDLIFPRLLAVDGPAVLRELAGLLAAGGVVRDGSSLFRLLREREELGSTGIGHGVAVPHCKVRGLEEVVVAVGVTPTGIDFESADGKPVRLFFVVLSPHGKPAAHLQSLAAISRWVQSDEGHVQRIVECADADEIREKLLLDDAGE